MKFQKLQGLIAAPHTPFNNKLEIAYNEIPKQVAHLIAQGVTGAYVSGTTGEGICCSVEERKKVMEAWIKAAKGKLKIIVHIGALSIQDVHELGAHAKKVGADAVSIVPPNFFKPGSINALIDYLIEALKPVKDLPFYYYHTGMSGVTFPMSKFLEAADGKIKNLAGIKYNYPDLYDFQNCMHVCNGKYDMTWGIDEWYAAALAIGAKSAIGSTYNYMAPFYTEIEKNFKAGKQEKVLASMRKVCELVDILVQYGGVAAGKVMMEVHGIHCGDVRQPITSLSPVAKKDILARLKKLNVVTLSPKTK